MPQVFNNATDDEPQFERVEDFSGGMDEYNRPALLQPNVSQRLQNVMVDDQGRAKTRPGADGLGGASLAIGQRLECLVYYDTPTVERVCAAIANTLQVWDGTNWSTPAGYPFGLTTIKAMVQGNNLLYCSNASGQWYAFNASAGTWSGALGVTANDPPNGASILCWHTFRMLAAGVASAPDTVYVSALGTAGTGDWAAANTFRVGRGEGDPIVGMTVLTGQYALVAKEASLYVVQADPTVAIANWVVLRVSDSVGLIAKKTLITVGNMVMFLAADGIRSISPTLQADTPFELTEPLSLPMQPYIDRINWGSASKSCATRYKQFVFFAVPLDGATEPNYVLVFNSRTAKWSGYWTGWTPTVWCISRFAGVFRCLFGDSAGYVNQWKDYASEDLSTTYTDNGVDINWLIRTRSFLFGEPVNWKDPHWFEMRFESSLGNASIRAYLDGVLSQTVDAALGGATNALPLDLSFDLTIPQPTVVSAHLDGLNEFNEAFLEVEGTSQKAVVRNCTMAAFVNTIQDE